MKLTRSFSFENALHLANLSQLVYEKSDDDIKEKCGYKNIKHFNTYGGAGAHCYGFENNDHIILSFRGTEPTSFKDIKTNLNMIPGKDYDGLDKGKIHTGFRDDIDTIWEDILDWLKTKSKKQIYTCGHSLGGAMSGIAASRLKGSICYNYGCPRIGNEKWTKEFNKNSVMYRFVNNSDIVPKMPPIWMRYKHTGDLFFINKDGKIRKNPSSFEKIQNLCKLSEGINNHAMIDYCSSIKDWVEKK